MGMAATPWSLTRRMRERRVGLVGDRRVVEHLEIGAAARERPEPAAVDEPQEQIAASLVELGDVVTQRVGGHRVGVRHLHGAVHGKRHPLTDAENLGDERRRRGAVADLPAGRVVRLSERADHDGARRDVRVAGQALVTHAVEPDVLVDLVRDHDGIGVRQHRREGAHVVLGPDHPGRVVRRVEDDDARPRRDRAPHLVPVDAVVGIAQRDVARNPAAQLDRRRVRVVGRLEQHHFVARMHERGERGVEALGGAGRDRDLGVGVVAPAVEALDLRRQRLAQRQDAGHRRVLVEAVAHVARDRLDERRRRAEVGEALRQVDGLALARQPAHHLENADRARWELRLQGPHRPMIPAGQCLLPALRAGTTPPVLHPAIARA